MNGCRKLGRIKHILRCLLFAVAFVMLTPCSFAEDTVSLTDDTECSLATHIMSGSSQLQREQLGNFISSTISFYEMVHLLNNPSFNRLSGRERMGITNRTIRYCRRNPAATIANATLLQFATEIE